MDVNEKEKIYHEVEQNALKKYYESNDLKNSVAVALFDNYKNLSQKDIIDFIEYLDFAHGYSINIAHDKGLGKIADVDYEILKQCKSIEREIKAANPAKTTKEFDRYSKKVDRLYKQSEELLDELSK